MTNISSYFLLSFGHPEGCGQCGAALFESDTVAYVDEEIVCKNCCESVIDSEPLMKLARRKQRSGGRHGKHA